MDNNLSSMLYALNTYHQRSNVDEASLLAGKIKVFSRADGTAQLALDNVIADLVAAYPNSNMYTLIDYTVGVADPTNVCVFLTIRLN